MIYDLVKKKGYTLEGANQKIKKGNFDVHRKDEVIGKLKEIKSFLIELENSTRSIVISGTQIIFYVIRNTIFKAGKRLFNIQIDFSLDISASVKYWYLPRISSGVGMNSICSDTFIFKKVFFC